MKTWAEIEAIATERKGGEQALAALLGEPIADITTRTDAEVLQAFALGIFSAGFRYSVVQAKRFEIAEAFGGFDVGHVAGLDAEDIEALCQDRRLIRNRTKILAIQQNAQFILRVASEHGSMVNRLAAWPKSDLIGLFDWLKKHGSRLGGATGSRALRSLGVDTFIISPSVGEALIAHGGFSKSPTGKAARRQAQEAFNSWHAESGRGYTELSWILAYSVP
jgi:3-methyladenine DNA glycosylase Tag